MTRRLTCLVFVLLVTASAWAEKVPTRFHPVGTTDKAPKIDGVLNDACWKHAVEMTGLSVPGSGLPARNDTTLWMVRDDKTLYVAVRASEPGMDKLSPASKAHDDGTMWKNDCVEMFFSPTGSTTEYIHLIVNRLGTVYDSTCRRDPEKDNMDPNVEYDTGTTTAAAELKSAWVLEIAIPLKGLGKVPANGDRWLFNVVRDNPTQRENTSWARLDEVKWHVPEQFGHLQFVRQTPGVDIVSPPSLERDNQVELNLVGSGTYTVRAHVSPYDVDISRKVKLEKGKPQPVVIDYTLEKLDLRSAIRGTAMVELTDNDTGTLLWRHVYRPANGYLRVASADLDPTRLIVSPDMPVSMSFDMKHTFAGGDPGMGMRIRKDNFIIVETPEGVTVEGRGRGDKTIKQETFTRDGTPWRRTTIKGPFFYSAKHWRGLRFRTTRPEGWTGEARFWVEWDGGKQQPQVMTLESMAVGKTRPPKRFVTGAYALWLGKDWTDEDFTFYRDMGMNTLSVRCSPKDEAMIEKILEAKKRGWWMRLGDYYFPGGKEGWLKWTAQDRDARSRDIDGYYISGGKGFQISPTYRGKMFEVMLADDIEVARRTGINWFAFDMEGYVLPRGDKACFHERSIEMFKDYLAKQHPKLKYVDPRVFEKDPEKYPELHRAWIGFKDHAFAGFFAKMKSLLAAAVGQTSPWKGVVFSEWPFHKYWDPEATHKKWIGPEFARVFDIFETSGYSSVDRYRREMTASLTALDKSGVHKDIMLIGCPSPQRWPGSYYATDDRPLENELKYKMFEACGFGAKGLYPWYRAYFNVPAWKVWVAGIRVINKVEDILVDGTRIPFPNVTTSNPKVNAHGVAHGRQAVIVVSEYLTDVAQKSTIGYAVEVPSVVVDAETDEVLGQLTPDAPSIEITIDDERARMLVIRPAQND